MSATATETLGFVFTEEQEALRKSVRSFLEQKSPEAEVRRLAKTPDGHDPQFWAQLSGQLGLTGLVVPEELGGSGYGFVELAVVLEELGRSLAVTPFLATTIATQALLHSGDDKAMKEHLPRIAAGEVIATLALSEDTGDWAADRVRASASPAGDAWSLTGAKSFVLDGATADLILVVARSTNGASLYAVDRKASGLTCTSLPSLDETRKLSRVQLEDVPATLIGEEGAAATVVERVLDLAAVALAAEQVGGAQSILERTVRYTSERVQFGRPIGSFQAIKHKCSDMLLAIESAKTAAYYGAFVAADLDEELPVIAATVKSYCSDAYFRSCAEAIQVHGAIGFTWEHPAHLYYKRAKSTSILFGTPVQWRETLARRLGI